MITIAIVLVFTFFCIGKKGTILKRVSFIEFGFFNMGLGDVDKQTGEVNYLSITDNGDRDKVLARVASAIVTSSEGASRWLLERQRDRNEVKS